MRSFLILLVAFLSFFTTVFGQTTLPSSAPKILPEELVSLWESAEAPKMVIFNTGPVNDIKDAINIGAVEEKKKLKKLKKHLKRLPKDTLIIYYCGCCPLATCPNLLPAYNLLNEMGFTNHKALDMPKSIKLDWMDKGYPMKK